MIIDILIIIVIIGSIITGFIKGFVKELSVTAGLIFGFYIAVQKYPILEKVLFKVPNPSMFHNIVSFLIIFFLVFLLIILLGLILKKIIQLIMLGWFDKMLGGLFGIVQGAIFIWVMLMLIMVIFPKTQGTISNSRLAVKIIKMGTDWTRIPIKIQKQRKLLTQTEKFFIIKIINQHDTKSSCC